MFDREKEAERLREKCLEPKLYEDDSSVCQRENPYLMMARISFSNQPILDNRVIAKIIFEE